MGDGLKRGTLDEELAKVKAWADECPEPSSSVYAQRLSALTPEDDLKELERLAGAANANPFTQKRGGGGLSIPARRTAAFELASKVPALIARLRTAEAELLRLKSAAASVCEAWDADETGQIDGEWIDAIRPVEG